MTELHYRYVIVVEGLRVGRLCLARPQEPLTDDMDASLQPSVALGTVDMQAPF